MVDGTINKKFFVVSCFWGMVLSDDIEKRPSHCSDSVLIMDAVMIGTWMGY